MVVVVCTGVHLHSPGWLVNCAVASILVFTAICISARRRRRDDGGDGITKPPGRCTTWFAWFGYPFVWSGWIGYPVLVLVALVSADGVRTSLDDVVGRRNEGALAYFGKGNALLVDGEYEEACEQYAEAVALHPRFAEAYGNWGIALGRLGRHAAACRKFAKAATIKPRDARAHTNWGRALCALGRYAEACGKCAKAVQLDPRNAWAYCCWGIALAEMGDVPEAEHKWVKATELDPALKPQIEEMRKQFLEKD